MREVWLVQKTDVQFPRPIKGSQMLEQELGNWKDFIDRMLNA
ncbi:protein YpfM [Rahnella inusitata]